MLNLNVYLKLSGKMYNTYNKANTYNYLPLGERLYKHYKEYMESSEGGNIGYM